jgi:hypothetical protein
MPSVEEYQEQSRIAAELAINNNSQWQSSPIYLWFE